MSISKERAEELFSAFKTKRILVVGDAFIDSYTFGVINRLNPEDTSAPQLDVTHTEYRSGGAGNVARNMASLGAKWSTLLAIRGNDERGLQLVQIGTREGYEPYFVVDDRKTIEKNRPINETNKLLMRLDHETPEERRPIGKETVEQLLVHARTLIPEVDGILVSDYAKGVITEAFSSELLALARAHQKPVLADVKPVHIGYFAHVEMMAPNLKEAIASVGKEFAPSVEEVASLLAKRYTTKVFLTAGAQGICIAEFSKESKGNVPLMVPQAHSRQVADSSGCGDTAAATILLAILCGATPQEAAELANAAAAETVTKVGAYAPTPAEVLRMLAS